MDTATQAVEEVDLPLLDFADPEVAADPFAAARELASEGYWLARTPFGYGVLTWEDCKELTRHKNLNTPEGLGLKLAGIESGVSYDWVSRIPLGTQDPVEHDRRRRLVTPGLTPSEVEKMRPVARELIETLIAGVAEDKRTNYPEMASFYSIGVICALLKFPSDNWRKIAFWSDAVSQIAQVGAGDESARMDATILEMRAYMDEELQKLIGREGDDLLSRLLRDAEKGERTDYVEVLHLIETLLTAGAETTKTMLSLALWTFAKHPDQWQALGEDPSLAASAVEEILRYRTIGMGVGRAVYEDLEWRGHLFPAGAQVLLVVPTANFDPEAYDDPESFNIRRFVDGSRAPKTAHLTFGFGMHVCAGAGIARMEMQEALAALAQAWPNLRIDESDPQGIELTPVYGIHGPSRLPLAWD